MTPASAAAGGYSPSPKERFRDTMVNLVVETLGDNGEGVFRRFRRATLWSLFRAYDRPLVLAPCGPPNNRFVMWLEPQQYSDFILGTYEPTFTHCLEKSAHEGSMCVDIGANLGYFTVLMSRLVGSTGRVVAFEPMPDTLNLLRKTIHANQLKNVTVEGAAVSSASGSLELLSEMGHQLAKTASAIGYRLGGATQVQRTTVPAIRLDDYFREGDRLPDVVKIDVEGGELEVLEGARATLQRGHPVMVIEIHGWGGDRSSHVLQLLCELGYQAKVIETRPPEALCLAEPVDGYNVATAMDRRGA
jgi:FkbM family methyltransferase